MIFYVGHCLTCASSTLARLECRPGAVMASAPTARDEYKLSKRYCKLRALLFTFIRHPDIDPGNNSGERELPALATYQKVTDEFRSHWKPTCSPRSIRQPNRGLSRHQRLPSYQNNRTKKICARTGLSRPDISHRYQRRASSAPRMSPTMPVAAIARSG